MIGLLIEPSKDYATLLTRNRKITSINACLSKDSSPHVVEFQSYGAIGGIKGEIHYLICYMHLLILLLLVHGISIFIIFLYNR